MRYFLFGMALVGSTVWNPAPAQAQPNTLTKEEIADGWILGFDGTSTTGWNIQGDAKVVDGVLVLGGVGPTRAQATPLLGRTFQLRLEYRTEKGNWVPAKPGWVIPIEIGWETRGVLARGFHSGTLERQSKDQGEWIEIIYTGEFDPANGTRQEKSRCRAVGEAAFVTRELGGTNLTGGTSFTIEIPAGAKLHVRNVKLQTEPTESTPWYLWVCVLAPVGVGTLVVWIWRRRARAA
jgi:hypothetical protein